MSKPQQPVFPKDWYQHCPKVLEAKEWYQRLTPNAEFVEENYAECAFHDAGSGKECENCRAFLTRPFAGHRVDEEFLPKIEQFYRNLEQYNLAIEQYEKDLAKGKPSVTVMLDRQELEGLVVALRWFKNTPKMYEQVSSEVRNKVFGLLSFLEGQDDSR